MTTASIIIPAFEEGPWIADHMRRLIESVMHDAEFLVVVDSEQDLTIPHLQPVTEEHLNARVLINTYGRGPANAIRFGLDHSIGHVAVVFMADGCDDPRQVDDLVRLVQRGVSIAAASRYAPGGQQVGGPRLKRLLSRLAGKSFQLLSGVGTKDATNSFKAYDRNFLNSVGVESRFGFEVGIELVAKARRSGFLVAEIPTTWIDRAAGKSNFQLLKWLPKYMHWYLYGLGIGKTERRQKNG